MRSSRRTEVSYEGSAPQLTDHSIGTELTTAWKSLSQSKAALRHIENRLEAAPGTGVLMESVMDPLNKKSSRTVRSKDIQQTDDKGGPSKRKGRSQQSPEKSSSRSPLRNTTQDSNVRTNTSVEFRDPLASFREATPPSHPPSQLEAYSLHSVPGSSYPSSPPPSDLLPSQMVYQRDTRYKQTDRDLDSTRSSAVENTEVRYLNDQHALVTLRTAGNQSHLAHAHAVEGAQGERTPKAQPGMDCKESSPCLAPTPGSVHRGGSTPSTSPGSASQRLENLRRHQPDDKLEKLKERIRRQRQHLEEAAEKEKLMGNLEQPITAAVGSTNAGTSTMPVVKIRKVAAAPPAPIYKGFNSTETKIRTPDGKVWIEEEFHNLSREIYRDLSRQFAETTRLQHQKEQRRDRSKERRPPKPVRKVHRAAPSSDLNAKPAAISPASWREGQKLVKMVLGSVPKLPREDRAQPADAPRRTASRHRSSSDPRSNSKSQPRPQSTERPRSGFQGKSKSHSVSTSTPSSAGRDKDPVGVSADILSADIQGILDDLQLECKAAEKEERARQRSRGGSSGRRGRGGSGSQTRTPVSAWGTNVATGSSSRGWRSASPPAHRPVTAHTEDTGHKKRHYDADTVRQYITRQQEERKRRQAEDKRAAREEAERRNQRLQELYRKQREVAKTAALPNEASVAPVQKRLQETYSKLLLEEAQLDKEATQTQPAALSTPMRPMYQPSGESDKENKRLGAPQSPSSSDQSLNDQPPPPLSRNDLDFGIGSSRQSDRLSSAVRPSTGPSSGTRAPYGDNLLSQLLRLESAVAASDIQHTQRPATAPSNRSRSKVSRIEALKATAASLSNRIESEARKLAGDGINYGTVTTMDTILDQRPSQANLNDRCWAETTAPENEYVASRIQRILTNTGHSSYNGTDLPGTGDLYALGGHQQTKATHNQHTSSADVTKPIHNRKLSNGWENEAGLDKAIHKTGYELMEDNVKNGTDPQDSSAGSISEGLLSEGSFSEEEASPPRPPNKHSPRAANLIDAVDYCAAQRRDNQRLSDFRREAARCSALTSPFAQHDGSKAAWEELNKGSPLSVINIFTKNLHGHAKANETNSPSAHSLHSGNGHIDSPVYEDDFVSSHSSGASGHLKRGSNSRSVNSHFEELMRRSPYEKSTGGGVNSHHSSFHSSVQSPHLSSGSTSASSPFSKHSPRRRGTASDQSDATLVGEQRSSCSPPSEDLSSDSRKKGSDKRSVNSQAKSVHTNDSFGETAHQSGGLDSKKSLVTRPKHGSPSGSSGTGSPPGAGSSSEPVRNGSLEANNANTGTTGRSGIVETRTTGELQYSPAVLQQRMAAELQYLESIEESVRQLGDMERLMSVSLAQQESVSLAQMLMAKQQSHERDLYELKIKAEREALETQLQLEENRQRMARAHIELQEGLAGAQSQTLEGLQEATMKMMSQQAEAARYTADTARHIKEMTEMARTQIAGALVAPPVATDSSMLDKQEEQHSSYSKRQQDKLDSDSFPSEASSRRTRTEEPLSSLNSLSYSDSLSFKRPNLSGADSSSRHSPLHVSSDQREKEAAKGKWRKGGAEEKTEREPVSSSIEEEAQTAANDSLCSDSVPSALDEKGDTTSVATEYSLKFDESMTEDEIEERSFRSLLPSEAHRRGNKERSRHQEESEEDVASHNATLVSGTHNILKSQDANMAFSGGQDSFSQFTMDMVRQYMKDEEVRLQHQSSLLCLRQKALKEKTRTELAWLEHQKKRLRDKGEDDKMPPIRKKQRGLLIKLQQEQAEIKRLQEANKAARKERQLLLKQQEEIERMRNSTLRLKERLKCAGGNTPPETPVSEAALSNTGPAEDTRSPSPSLSVSGSETSSIMQKLKKMRSHMDEKFLTKREQQLMQRRHHAEELLQWKQRLDQEEAEVRRIEKEALAVWDGQTPQDKNTVESQKKDSSDASLSPSQRRSSEPRTDSEKDYVSEGDCSSATPESSIHTEGLESQQPGSPASVQPASIAETPLASVQGSPANYTQDFTSASQSPRQSPFKGSHSPAASPSDGSSKTKMQLRSTSRTPNQATAQPADSPMATQIEPISDQSDIECRIKALKEELRKRKFMAYQLKKEQKKRHKERLKAQEASLLKQLENYDNFIEKTKAELKKEPDSTSDTKSQIKDSISIAEQSNTQPTANRSESKKQSDSERTQPDASQDRIDAGPQPDHSRSTSVPEELSEEDPPTVTPTPVYGSPEAHTTGQRSRLTTEGLSRPPSKEDQAQMIGASDGNIMSHQSSEFQEVSKVEFSSKFKDQPSEHLLNLEKELDTKHVSSSMSEEHPYSPSVSVEQDKKMKTRESTEAEEAVKSYNTSSKMHSAAVELETSQHENYCSSNDGSRSPDSNGFSKKEAPVREFETSCPILDGYHDDFESSVDSSPRGEHHSSKLASQTSKKVSPSRVTPNNSQDEVLEEEIAEELSHRSDSSEASHKSGRLLDLHGQSEGSKHDTKDLVNSTHSPPRSSLKTPLSPVVDEMNSFNIGDRVLVGGVQPGTLRFKGPTSFANGFWAGVELDKSEGSNNGTYDGVVYFQCDESHGIFAPPEKITHLPDKFEMYMDTTEDEDSFFDDPSDKGGNKNQMGEEKSQEQRNHRSTTESTSNKVFGPGGTAATDGSVQKVGSNLNSQQHKEAKHPITNGTTRDIILEFEDAPTTLLISDIDKIVPGKSSQKDITTHETDDVDSKQRLTTAQLSTKNRDDEEQEERDSLDTFADTLLNNFVNDTVKQFAEIKKAKQEKIVAANQMNGELFGKDAEEEWFSSVEQKDGLPFFLPTEKEELSSPELCNRPESPVLGASGQEELAKRLAELELSRELLDNLGDDQDWFDEDYGLSSRREQQRLKQKQREEEEEARLGGGLLRSGSSAGSAMGGLVPSPAGEQQVKTPPRPELPLPMPPKLPEQPAMVVPHSATEVEKMVQAATKEIWENFGLGKEGAVTLAQLPNPDPSQEYLGKEPDSHDQEALCIRSYRKAVYDLTWEMLQEIYAEDPNADQPQWVKPRRVKSSSFHRLKTPGDITKIQEYITAEVLKLYGLKKDQNQKTDWQKMLKFGRKKRDKVDHILVQELHEEEAQWVNYDEDELFVKMQLADSIFDALLKDTANVLTLIYDKRAKRDTLS